MDTETAQTQALSITNIGQQTDSLNASVDSTSGGAFATGSISNLFGGLTDNTSMVVGVSTSSAGAISGGVTVALTGGQVLPTSLAYGTPTGGSLGTQNLTVQGGVYNYAALGIANIGTVGTLTGLSFVVNAVVGTGISTANLAIENVAPVNGFSESLLVGPAYPLLSTAQLSFSGFGISGNALSSGNPSILAGAERDVTITFDPTAVGVYIDDVTLSLGSVGYGIDQLGLSPLTNTTLSITFNVTSGVSSVEVPEPTSLLLLGAGIVGLATARRRPSNLVRGHVSWPS